MKQAIIEALKYLKKDVTSDPEAYTTANIDSYLRVGVCVHVERWLVSKGLADTTIEAMRITNAIMRPHFKTWLYFSGNDKYPVPALHRSVFKCPSNDYSYCAYHYHYSYLWVGLNRLVRLNLIDHLIKELERDA